jgi:hypothetical protein
MSGKPLGRIGIALGALALGALLLATPPAQAPRAAGTPLEIKADDTIRSVLERSVGNRVEIVLVSGEKLSGTVKLVNAELVHLAALQGRDFYDAVARVERIDAVVVRMRDR